MTQTGLVFRGDAIRNRVPSLRGADGSVAVWQKETKLIGSACAMNALAALNHCGTSPTQSCIHMVISNHRNQLSLCVCSYRRSTLHLNFLYAYHCSVCPSGFVGCGPFTLTVILFFRLTEPSGYLTDGPINYKFKTKCTWLIEG